LCKCRGLNGKCFGLFAVFLPSYWMDGFCLLRTCTYLIRYFILVEMLLIALSPHLANAHNFHTLWQTRLACSLLGRPRPLPRPCKLLPRVFAWWNEKMKRICVYKIRD